MNEIYNEVVKLLNQLIRSSKDAMSLCQQWTYNGRKRYYQEDHIWYSNKLDYIKKKAYDMFNVSIDKNRPDTFVIIDENLSMPYMASGYKDHFVKWLTFLKTSIANLTNLHKQIYSEIGLEDRCLKKVLRHLYKDQERHVRKFRQYEKSGWNSIELHADDNMLHAREKKSMKEKGIK